MRWNRISARVKQFRRVLDAALEDPHYRPLLASRGLGSRREIGRVDDVESILQRLPFSGLDAVSRDIRYPGVVRHPLHPWLWACAPATEGHYSAIAAPKSTLLELAGSARRPQSERG